MMGGYISYDDYAANVRLNGGVPDPDPRAGNNNNSNGSSGGSGNSSGGSRGGSGGSGNSGGNSISEPMPPLPSVELQTYNHANNSMIETTILSDEHGNYFAKVKTIEEMFGISLNITRKTTNVIDTRDFYYTELWVNIDDIDILLGYENHLYVDFDYINLTTILNAFGVILDVPIMTQGGAGTMNGVTNCGPTAGAMVEKFYNPDTTFTARTISNAVTRARKAWLEDGIDRGYDYNEMKREEVKKIVVAIMEHFLTSSMQSMD
jgi:hypothetical protein